jgi:hypothetical protein
MGNIVRVRLTEYWPFQKGMSEKQKKMEGGTKDRKGNPLYALEDYLEGDAPYVSLACDFKGGAPGNVKEFREYGYQCWIPALQQKLGRNESIIFRLVDTGRLFYGKGKKIKVAGREPIDVCRRSKPAEADSFSGMLADLFLLSPAGGPLGIARDPMAADEVLSAFD